MRQMEFNFNENEPARPTPKEPLTKEYIANMLRVNRNWVSKGVIAIYNRQTPDEKSISSTFMENGKGFNSYDAYVLSELAKTLLAKGLLSNHEWNILHKRMPKYAGQLLQIAKEKGNV